MRGRQGHVGCKPAGGGAGGARIAPPLWSLGASARADLSGLDAALLRSDGTRIHDFGPAAHRPYSRSERSLLRAAIGSDPADPRHAVAAELVETAHAELLAKFDVVDLVGLHGQRLGPEPYAPLLGDAAVLAQVLGVPVVWDFRAADRALGGRGGPLSAFFHFAAACWIGAQEPLAFLDLGRTGWLSWVDPGALSPETAGALLAFETGPAMGAIGPRAPKMSDGCVDADILARALDSPYFARRPPKALTDGNAGALDDPVALLAFLPPPAAQATLRAICAACVARGLEHLPIQPAQVLVFGPGAADGALMRALKNALPVPVDPVEAMGLDGPALRAQAVAHLAVRVLHGMATSCPSSTGVAASVGGGQICRSD